MKCCVCRGLEASREVQRTARTVGGQEGQHNAAADAVTLRRAKQQLGCDVVETRRHRGTAEDSADPNTVTGLLRVNVHGGLHFSTD
jgi:hypothetical protein